MPTRAIPAIVTALRFLMLTMSRPGEANVARCIEIVTEAAFWIIPLERVEIRHENQVPLLLRALQVLATMR
jgi:integrase